MSYWPCSLMVLFKEFKKFTYAMDWLMMSIINMNAIFLLTVSLLYNVYQPRDLYGSQCFASVESWSLTHYRPYPWFVSFLWWFNDWLWNLDADQRFWTTAEAKSYLGPVKHASGLSNLLLSGSNMVFHALTFARSRGRCWKPRPKAEVFNTSRGIWQTLMYWKTIIAVFA